MQNETLNFTNENTIIIKTDEAAKNGQNKCPKCGATDIILNENTGKLKCEFCRYEFEPKKLTEMVDDISQLKGQVIGSGAQDIVADTNDVLTFKCSSCGAEVVIDTSAASQARCHWCRNILSVNQQIPNGSIPDVVLPFSVSRDTAKLEIEKFVRKRKFFAHPKFKQEFTTQNIMGVYFPYMVVDVNSHMKLSGQGEHQVRKYVRGSGENAKVYYDVDVYNIEREFDLAIKGLTVESNSKRLEKNSNETNNVINAIMPFDIENCVRFNSNYLKGYTSERRDKNVEGLKDIVEKESKDVAVFACNDTLKEYDRGVAWSSKQFSIKGEQWKAAYLPVWLYSYQEVSKNKKTLHYVAVNARTKETMGSVPIHMPKLIGISILVEILGILATIYIDFDYSYLFLFTGFLYFIVIFLKYRNSNARHQYETDTKSQMSNLRKVDSYITRKTGVTNSKMSGVNNTNVSGESVGNKILNSVTENNVVAKMIKDATNKDGGNL